MGSMKARRPQRANRLGAKRLRLRSQLRGVTTWVPRPMLLLLMLGALMLVTLLLCCSGGIEKRATAHDVLRRRLPQKRHLTCEFCGTWRAPKHYSQLVVHQRLCAKNEHRKRYSDG